MDLLSETGRPTIRIAQYECTELELKLNVTSKNRLWSHIADMLFDFGSGKTGAATSILLTDEQYDFIRILMKRKSWEACRDL